jgi:hypothetical protein
VLFLDAQLLTPSPGPSGITWTDKRSVVRQPVALGWASVLSPEDCPGYRRYSVVTR